MATQVLKSTLSISGEIANSLPSSVRAAENQLRKLRQEQSADVREAKRLQQSLSQLQKGTSGYAQATRQLTQVQSRINTREQDILNFSKSTRTASGTTNTLTTSVGKLTGGLKSFGPKGIAAAAIIGLVVGAATLLNKTIRGVATESEKLQSLVNEGFDDISYQKLSRGLEDITGNAQSAKSAAQGLIDTTRTLATALEFDPTRLDPNQLRAFAELDIDVRSFIDQDQIDQTIALAQGAQQEIQEQLAAGATLEQARRRAGQRVSDAVGGNRELTNSVLEIAQAEEGLLAVERRLRSEGAWSDELKASSIEYNKSLNSLGRNLSFIGQQALLPILKVVEPLIASFADWVMTNKDTIGSMVEMATTVVVMGNQFVAFFKTLGLGIDIISEWRDIGLAAVSGVELGLLSLADIALASFEFIAAGAELAFGWIPFVGDGISNLTDELGNLREANADAQKAAEGKLKSNLGNIAIGQPNEPENASQTPEVLKPMQQAAPLPAAGGALSYGGIYGQPVQQPRSMSQEAASPPEQVRIPPQQPSASASPVAAPTTPAQNASSQQPKEQPIQITINGITNPDAVAEEVMARLALLGFQSQFAGT